MKNYRERLRANFFLCIVCVRNVQSFAILFAVQVDTSHSNTNHTYINCTQSTHTSVESEAICSQRSKCWENATDVDDESGRDEKVDGKIEQRHLSEMDIYLKNISWMTTTPYATAPATTYINAYRRMNLEARAMAATSMAVNKFLLWQHVHDIIFVYTDKWIQIALQRKHYTSVTVCVHMFFAFLSLFSVRI